MTNTKQLINTLGNPATSTFEKAEALFTLTKHNLFTHLKDELKTAYIMEDYITAYDLLKDIKITTIKPKYTQYKPKTRRGDSRQLIGVHMVTQGDNTGWLEGIKIMERLNLLDEIKTNPLFTDRSARLKAIMKRKARLTKAKYKRRERVVLPSTK